MRLRACGLACALTVLGSLGASAQAGAAPRFNHHLTIAATPREVISGDGVVIYGRLLGSNSGGQTIWLYHHIAASGRPFSLIGSTTTDPSGYYEFLRPEGIVYTNRGWFVRGPAGAHSRTVYERVQALISVRSSSSTGDTAHTMVFRGHLTPTHSFERVYLQRQNPDGGDWSNVASALVRPGSNYTLKHRFRVPGAYPMRVLFRGDRRNIRSFSDTVNVVIQQAQTAGFTINTSSPLVPQSGSATISGILDKPGTTTPEAGTVVQLWGAQAGGPFRVLADKPTGADGSYSFTQKGLTVNTTYYVATLRLPHSPSRQTARLFEGIQDELTMQPSTDSATTGQTVTFSGTVLPDKAGRAIYLERLGKDGNFHIVEVGIVRHDSTFQFTYTMGSPKSYTFRARIASDRDNVGAASTPVTVTATTPAASSLTGAS